MKRMIKMFKDNKRVKRYFEGVAQFYAMSGTIMIK